MRENSRDASKHSDKLLWEQNGKQLRPLRPGGTNPFDPDQCKLKPAISEEISQAPHEDARQKESYAHGRRSRYGLIHP